MANPHDAALQLMREAVQVVHEENLGPRAPVYTTARQVVALERIAAALENLSPPRVGTSIDGRPLGPGEAPF